MLIDDKSIKRKPGLPVARASHREIVFGEIPGIGFCALDYSTLTSLPLSGLFVSFLHALTWFGRVSVVSLRRRARDDRGKTGVQLHEKMKRNEKKRNTVGWRYRLPALNDPPQVWLRCGQRLTRRASRLVRAAKMLRNSLIQPPSRGV